MDVKLQFKPNYENFIAEMKPDSQAGQLIAGRKGLYKSLLLVSSLSACLMFFMPLLYLDRLYLAFTVFLINAVLLFCSIFLLKSYMLTSFWFHMLLFPNPTMFISGVVFRFLIGNVATWEVAGFTLLAVLYLYLIFSDLCSVDKEKCIKEYTGRCVRRCSENKYILKSSLFAEEWKNRRPSLLKLRQAASMVFLIIAPGLGAAKVLYLVPGASEFVGKETFFLPFCYIQLMLAGLSIRSYFSFHLSIYCYLRTKRNVLGKAIKIRAA
ncbi:hypothetical protein [Thioclava sp. GXIMD4215]|uniref:hypothetical protein n=1 Tax=Thioclava sp. GXIMD4215 TaxID=3131928 RepID=UPI00311B0DCC